MTADEARRIAQSHPLEDLTIPYIAHITEAANESSRHAWFEKMPIEVQLDLARLGYRVQGVYPKGFEVRW